MHNRKAIQGAGITLTTVAIGLYASGWSEQVRAHPWIIAIVALIGIVLIVYGFFIPNPPVMSAPTQKMKAGRDIKGSQFHAEGNIHYYEASETPTQKGEAAKPTTIPSKLYINSAEYSSADGSGEKYDVTDCLRQLISDDRLIFDVENHTFQAGGRNFVPKDPKPYVKKMLRVTYSFDKGPLQTIEQTEGYRIELPAKTQEPETSLGIRREWRDVIYDAVPGSWRLANPNEMGSLSMLILWVDNPYPQKKGARGTSLIGLTANIRIANYEREQVPKAYWLEQRSNTVDLECGSERGVVIGHFKDKRFVSYENPYTPQYQPTFDVPYRELGNARSIELIGGSSSIISIRVTIVESSSDKVLDQRELRIHLPAGITELLDPE